MTQEGISEMVGEGAGLKGRRTKVYRALRELLCSSCGTPIPEGALFTRETIRQFGLRLMPRCRECAPFEFEGVAGPKRSKMLENLLDAPAETGERPTAAETNGQAGGDSPTRHEGVASRLGPALARGRRKR